MRERILLMGGPGSGKSYQILKVISSLSECWVLDCEDKLEAMLGGIVPPNMHLSIAMEWEDIRATVEGWKKTIKGESPWVIVDRTDLLWPSVQRWYVRNQYHREMADVMAAKAAAIKSSFMIAPRLDQGSWQIVNETYDYVIMTILYGLKANVILTAGVKSSEGDSPFELLGGLGIAPRGQKELAHQPHTVLLLQRERESRGVYKWTITSAKDLPGRPVFDGEDLMDLSIQYPHFG